jgi:acyltransferase-like protein/SGNH domain-containing protein
MWSLSLEEQFYLFWPLLLVTLYKYIKKYLLGIIAILILASLFLSEFYFSTDPEAVFFLIPFRMFEFLLGASCIWLERFSSRHNKYLLELLFLLGLFLIMLSAVEFNSYTTMPGWRSLVPCVGAMLIIYGGKAPYMSWILKNKTVELIGKSSYSIYLIHWPLIVYYGYWTLIEMSLINKISLGLISLVLGLLMWRFIENTFRYRKIKTTKRDPVWYVIPALILNVSVASGMVWQSKGVPSRYPDELYMPKEEILANREMYFDEYREKGTLLGGKANKGHIMVMGNSHSIDLIFALRQNGMDSKITALKILGKCYNFGESYFENAKETCNINIEENLNNENWNRVNAIYLHDHWPNWDADGFNRIIKRIRKVSIAPIFVFGPKMTYNNQIPEIVRLTNSMVPHAINENAKIFARKIFKVGVNDSLKMEFQKPYYSNQNVYFIDILRLQGGEKLNSFEIISGRNLKFLYFDNSHFTRQGSKEFGAKMKFQHPYLFNIKALKEKYPI